MRIYSAFDEETLRARRLVREWTGQGLLNAAQGVNLEADTESDLRRTNGFLRLVLFLFTAGTTAAGLALLAMLLSIRDHGMIAVLLVMCSAASYGLAEYAVARGRFYRHGIEEAFAVQSVLYFCAGLATFLSLGTYTPDSRLAIVPMAGALASYLVYRRFGYHYAFFSALLCLAFVPSRLVSSQEVYRLMLGGCFLIGLVIVRPAVIRHRDDYLGEEYGSVQAMLWLALYLTVNLRLMDWTLITQWGGGLWRADNVARPYYWTTYVLIWFIPVIVLRQALRDRDKPLLGIGIVMALLTLVTNKPYLGWARHEWDPMLLGVFLVGTAMAVRRWLAQGPLGVRAGLTARRLTGADKQLLSALGTASGFLPTGIPGGAGAAKPEFGGGRSGGGGASSSF